MLHEEDYSVSGHKNFFHFLTHDKHIVQIYYYLNIYHPQDRHCGIFINFVKIPGAGLKPNQKQRNFKDSLNMKTEYSSLMTDAVELKKKHLSYIQFAHVISLLK